MWRSTLAGLRAHARRMAATVLAVVLGVGFVAGTLIFGDTAKAGYDETFARTAKNVDTVVLANGKGKGELLTAEQLAAVRATPGVEVADGRMATTLPMLGGNGRPLVNFGRAGLAVSTDGDDSLRAFDIRGQLPGPGEAMLDVETAAHQRLQAGDQLTVVDQHGARHTYAISGLIDFGVSKTYSGLSVVGLPAAQVTALTGQAEFDEIVVRGRAGVSQEDLAKRISAAVSAGPKVVTGDQRRTDLADDATQVAAQFTAILLIFGVISLIVAIFVIYNTFAILLAQRVRETALLRCVGATRRQVFTATVLESGVLGLAGGALGVLAGVGVSYGLFGLLNGALNAGVPAHPVVLRSSPVLIGLATGLVVTVLAALPPAARATRTSPLAALRDLPTAAVRRSRKLVRGAAALVVAAAGIAVTVRGGGFEDSETGSFVIVGGGVVVFLGVLIAAPLFIGPLTALVGFPATRLAGPPARVAVANARRNPGRTAVTTATLMIGVGLMALFSVLLGSIKETARVQLTGHYPIDYVVTAIRDADGELGTIPSAYAQSLHGRREFAAVIVVRQVEVRIDGKPARLAAFDRPDLVPNAPAGLTDGTVIVSAERTVADLTVTVGGKQTRLRAVGSADLSVPGDGQADALVSWDQLAAIAGPGDDSVILVKAADGVSAVDSRRVLDDAGTAYPLVQVNSVADLSSDLETAVNGLIGLFAGLLGTAVLIALFGIANTLSLSVIERTRESATMRALGLTRGQLRGTLLIEALLMGVVGALVGIVFGLVYAPLVLRQAFKTIGPVIVVPWGWLAGLILLAATASALAAVLPARRAARGSIVAAMSDT
jgi:putative ABC transport system permease protein